MQLIRKEEPVMYRGRISIKRYFTQEGKNDARLTLPWKISSISSLVGGV
jgi:hypothetical protein